MPTMKERPSRGFTLIELMMVIAIIGVLAALAVYGVSRYIKHSKTAEATRSLGAVENGARIRYHEDSIIAGLVVHAFCGGAGPTPIAGVPAGQRVTAPPAEWNATGWQCLKFLLTEPQNYQYNFVSNSPPGSGTAAVYTASAVGDLDGNGTMSTFAIIGRGGASGEAVRLSLTVLNEDE